MLACGSTTCHAAGAHNRRLLTTLHSLHLQHARTPLCSVLVSNRQWVMVHSATAENLCFN